MVLYLLCINRNRVAFIWTRAEHADLRAEHLTHRHTHTSFLFLSPFFLLSHTHSCLSHTLSVASHTHMRMSTLKPLEPLCHLKGLLNKDASTKREPFSTFPGSLKVCKHLGACVCVELTPELFHLRHLHARSVGNPLQI